MYNFCVLTGLNCLAYDEAIIAQQDRIQQEVIPAVWLSSVLFLIVLREIFGDSTGDTAPRGRSVNANELWSKQQWKRTLNWDQALVQIRFKI